MVGIGESILDLLVSWWFNILREQLDYSNLTSFNAIREQLLDILFIYPVLYLSSSVIVMMVVSGWSASASVVCPDTRLPWIGLFKTQIRMALILTDIKSRVCYQYLLCITR